MQKNGKMKYKLEASKDMNACFPLYPITVSLYLYVETKHAIIKVCAEKNTLSTLKRWLSLEAGIAEGVRGYGGAPEMPTRLILIIFRNVRAGFTYYEVKENNTGFLLRATSTI